MRRWNNSAPILLLIMQVIRLAGVGGGASQNAFPAHAGNEYEIVCLGEI
jgi:hypothetical protein